MPTRRRRSPANENDVFWSKHMIQLRAPPPPRAATQPQRATVGEPLGATRARITNLLTRDVPVHEQSPGGNRFACEETKKNRRIACLGGLRLFLIVCLILLREPEQPIDAAPHVERRVVLRAGGATQQHEARRRRVLVLSDGVFASRFARAAAAAAAAVGCAFFSLAAARGPRRRPHRACNTFSSTTARVRGIRSPRLQRRRRRPLTHSGRSSSRSSGATDRPCCRHRPPPAPPPLDAPASCRQRGTDAE